MDRICAKCFMPVSSRDCVARDQEDRDTVVTIRGNHGSGFNLYIIDTPRGDMLCNGDYRLTRVEEGPPPDPNVSIKGGK